MLTVFTPAYNRAKTLARLYESLQNQSCFDFEWLIVDDGSTDETQEIVETFLNEQRFPVRYYKKENGGKHTAHNLAVTLAVGEWFFCVDSDDFLSENAVQSITDAAKTLRSDQGIIAYKRDVSGKRLSREFPVDVKYSHLNELVFVHGCGGEFSLIFPTMLVKMHPFPVFQGERFVTESVLYDRFDEKCQMLLLPKDITICEYQEDGYSQNVNSVMARNPNGYCLYFLQRIDIYSSFLSRLVCAGKYWCFRWMAKNRTLRYSGKHRVLTGLSLPLGLFFRVYYKLIRGF